MKTFRIIMAVMMTAGITNGLRIAEIIDNPDNLPALLFSMALMMIGGLGLFVTMGMGRHERGEN